jgi:polar amino acid transport system substrate-binding protein
MRMSHHAVRKSVRKIALVIGCSGVTAAVIAAVSSTAMAGVSCPKDIKIGWEEYKPFQFEEGGVVTGSDMEAFAAVMKKIGCPFTAEKSPWDRTLMEVETGKKLFAAGATLTAERQKFAFFTEPYDVEKIFPYVLKKNLKSMKMGSIADVLAAGLKIVTTSGVTYGDEYDSLIKDGKLVVGKNLFEAAAEKQAGEMIALGRADIYLASGEGLAFHPDITSAKAPLFVTETRFMISKKASSEAFLRKVNGGIASLTKDGTFKKIKKKYFSK